MQIKNVSKLVGLSIPTIRYYEQLGIIKPEKIGYYKKYTNEIIEQLKQIKMLKEAGLHLKDIQRIFHLDRMLDTSLSNNNLIELKNLIEKTLATQIQKEQIIISSKKILSKMLGKIENALEDH